MCGLSLAWITSENSTKLLESDSSWLTVAGPYLLCYCLSSPVLTAPVHGSTPTLCCPHANCSCPGPPSTASLASPSHFRIRRDFRSKNPLSGFAPKQTNESSALSAHSHSATRELKKNSGDQLKDTGERRKPKKIPRQDQTIQTKQNVPKQGKEILSTNRGKWAKPYH